MIDPQLLSILRCPVDGTELRLNGDALVSANGRKYPVVKGVPVLFPPDISETIGYIGKSVKLAWHPNPDDPFYLESVGISDEEREGVRALVRSGGAKIDPVVSFLVSATGGNAYRHLIGKVSEYPIPEFRIAQGANKMVLDLGCNWGRWCFAAARQGFLPVGLDPQLGAVLAARRVADKLGLKCHFVCADARQLPFAPATFDLIFSYSVLQHLSPENVRLVVQQAAKAARPDGQAFIQMPKKLGLLPLVRQFQRRFREARGFEVRYWSSADLRSVFGQEFGPVSFEVDCFFGIGLQASDMQFMTPVMKCAVRTSEGLRKASATLPFITPFADSVYVRSRKARAG